MHFKEHKTGEVAVSAQIHSSLGVVLFEWWLWFIKVYAGHQTALRKDSDTIYSLMFHKQCWSIRYLIPKREVLPAERGVKSDCWNDSADLKQPDTRTNTKVQKNAVELRAAAFVRGRQILLPWGLGEVGLDYSMVLLLGRTLQSSLEYANPRLVAWLSDSIW